MNTGRQSAPLNVVHNPELYPLNTLFPLTI